MDTHPEARMKQKSAAPAGESATLRSQLATAERNLEAWRTYGNEALARGATLETRLADLQRSADPTQLGAIMKVSAKLRAELAEAKSALADAHDSQDRLEAEINGTRQKLLDVETLEQRQHAAQAVAALATLAAPVERAAADLVATLSHLHAEADRAHVLVEVAVQALNLDPMVLGDWQQIVFPRAAACGPEAGSAIAHILYDVARASRANLDAHVTFNEFNRGAGTMTQALKAAAAVIASRLGVDL
jgi:cell wall assembly regulator SMI1